MAVFGNCDGDRAALRRRALELGISLHDDPLAFEADGKRLVVSHQPLDPAPSCDFYLHGHTHKLRHEGACPVVINPGEACGWLSGHCSCALLNTETREVEFFDL